MTIPLHLTLTGRPLLLHAPVVPEMQAMLESAYSDRAGRIADRAHRRAARKPGLLGGLFTRDQDGDDDAVLASDITDAPGPAAAQAARRIPMGSVPMEPRNDPYIAEITIRGPLLNRPEYFMGMLCVDGYSRIEADMGEAMADPNCIGIFLDIDSPGGMVNGCFELADRIRAWRDDKPIVAFTDGLACSAAYALAGSATELHGTLTAMIGSIGVIYGRLDTSKRDSDKGKPVHFFTSGSRKAFGHPELELGEQELAETQTQIDTLAAMFFDRVADARGITVDAVRDLQAGYYLTDAAIGHGIADTRIDRAAALARLTTLATTAPEPSTDPDPADDPAAAGLGGKTTLPTAAIRPASTSTPKEIPMSKLKAARQRASLGALLSTAAMSMALAMPDASALDPDALKMEIDEETDATLAEMEDEDVDAMSDDDDTDAMEDEDEPEAASDDDVDAAEEDDADPSARIAATRIARKATATLAAKSAASKAPKRSAKSGGGDQIDPAVAAQIQGLPEAKGRAKQAAALSITPGMTVDNARRILGASGKEGGSRLSGVPDPKVGASSRGQKLSAADAALAANAKALRAKVGQA